jgi:DmsE family decaheme c-type cytochrome
MRWSKLLLLPVALLWLATALAQEPEAGAALPEGYAGAEMCGVCHEDLSQAFAKTAHGQITRAAAGAWKGRECEACHGAGGTHAESGDAALIFRFRNAAAGRSSQACLECHSGQETQRGRLQGAHYRNSLDCVSCHSVHHSEKRHLLTAAANDLCSSCHTGERAAFRRPFTHRLEQNAIECVDCHNPHGGPPPASMQAFAANETSCLKCHNDKRGPFPFEHAPVKIEPCTTCHEPHGSANPRMMARHDVSQLCLECHTLNMSNPGGPPPAFHDLRSARFRNCTICHSKVHGSFVNKDLLR